MYWCCCQTATTYHAKLDSHYNAMPLRASTHKTYLLELQRLQNKALRIITKTLKLIRDSISPQYFKLKIF